MRAVLVGLMLSFTACSGGSAPPAPTTEPPPPAASDEKLTAVIHTGLGDITCELWPKVAPKTVANFVGLSEGGKKWKDPRTGQWRTDPLYNGTIFHRVMPGFMIQGGDPLGTGAGGPGFEFEDEVRPGVGFDKPGLLAMANRGPRTNGSQFFITDSQPTWLDGRHTIFGACDMPTVKKIIGQPLEPHPDPRQRSEPVDPVSIDWVEIRRG